MSREGRFVTSVTLPAGGAVWDLTLMKPFTEPHLRHPDLYDSGTGGGEGKRVAPRGGSTKIIMIIYFF